jgi:hypothetical protein
VLVVGRLSLVDQSIYWRPTPAWAAFDARDFRLPFAVVARIELGDEPRAPFGFATNDGSAALMIVHTTRTLLSAALALPA